MRKHPELAGIMNARNRELFSTLVETYLVNGNPVGSRTLSREIRTKLSPATVRNVMQDLEYFGLLESPHISSGRVPTEFGLRMFVDEILEIGDINEADRDQFRSIKQRDSPDLTSLMDGVGSLLSIITRTASLVLTPKHEAPIKHVEFVSLAPDRALVVLVTSDGNVENRVFEPPRGQTPSAMQAAANFLNSVSTGRTLSELREMISQEILVRKQELDEFASELISRGIAVWENGDSDSERLIVRGRSNLLEDDEGVVDLELIRELFDDLERKRDIASFLESVEEGEGVKIFIGSENKLFSLTGSTLVAAPYMNTDGMIVGAVGVIGPTRINYGRIVPIVDYTAQLVGRLLSERT